jgi:tRNA(Ile)-lysidine synthase
MAHYHRMVEGAEAKTTLRRDPAVRTAIRSWRALTGGSPVRDGARRTLLACSGGADSTAMALALGAATRHLVIAHVLHDLRPADQAGADMEAARALADRLNLPFASASVRVRAAGGNAEAAARRLRYRELARLAADHSCPFVAAAHHGDDLLETLLMRLIRGSGPRGLAVLQPARPMNGATLIRPLLEITRVDCERICTLAGVRWREDLTNRDTTRLRAALRAEVLPQLRRIAPRMAARARVASGLMADAAALVDREVRALLLQAVQGDSGALEWRREVLRGQPGLVVGAALRDAAARLTGGAGLDRLGWHVVHPAVEVIRGPGTEPLSFQWRGVRVEVSAHVVRLAPVNIP